MTEPSSRRVKIGIAAAVSALMLFSFTACAAADVPDSPEKVAEIAEDVTAVDAEVTEEVAEVAEVAEQSTANSDVLAAIVAAEQASESKLMDLYPGVYAGMTVDGSVEDQDGSASSVVRYQYTYANPVEWSAATEALDAQRPTLDSTCKTLLFPMMVTAGITGPMEVVFSYSDIDDASPMWEHTCSEG